MMVMFVQTRNLLELFLIGTIFVPFSCLLDQFVTDPAATVVRATGNHIVSFCRSFCQEEKAQLPCPLKTS